MKAIMPAYPIDLCDTRKEAAAAQAIMQRRDSSS